MANAAGFSLSYFDVSGGYPFCLSNNEIPCLGVRPEQIDVVSSMHSACGCHQCTYIPGPTAGQGPKSTAWERHLDPCRFLMGNARKSRQAGNPRSTRLPKIYTKNALYGFPVAETRSHFPTTLI